MTLNKSVTDSASAANLKKTRDDFALHVLLVMRRHNVSKSKAHVIAWLEGPVGLAKLADKDPAKL